MEHPSSLIPAVWYNYSSYNDLLNQARQLQPNVHTSHAPQISHMVAPPAHSPVPDVSFQIAEALPKPKKIRRPENYDGKERAFTCNQCTAAFYTQSKLNTHMRIHTGVKPYVCDECGKAFVQASNLKAHKRVHTGERPYPCEECGKSFRANSYLMVHKRIHSGEKPYICGFCNEGFYSSTYLANHIRVHTGEKPYVCEYCGEAYSQSLDLRMHKRIHTGDSPYKCWECNQAFISDKELTAHRKKSHKDSRPFRCEICRKKFRRPTFVAKHQAKCLGPAGTYSHTCALCGKGFRTETFCAKHQARCKGPKTKKRIGRPPKYPRAEGEEGDRRRKRGTGKRRSSKPIATTDRTSRSRTKTVKEEIKEEPEAETEVKEEKKEGIDIKDLVKELGIEGFTKESLDEITNEVIETIPKENITQELLKDLIEKKEQQRNINVSSTLTTQDLNGHQSPLSHIITSQHLSNEATHQTVSSNQTYSHHQQQMASDNQPEMSGHQHTMLSNQQALSDQQQSVPIQQNAPQSSIPHQLAQTLPGHHSDVGPAAQLAYERALPYVVDLSGTPSNAYYSRS